MTMRLRLPLLLLLALLLSACGSLPSTQVMTPPTDDNEVRQLLSAAHSAPPEQAARLRAEAAQRLTDQEQPTEALSILESIDKRRLPAELGLEIALQQAELALTLEQPDRALQTLDFRILPANLNNEQIIRLNQARADVFKQLDNPVSAVRELISASQMTQDTTLKQTLHNQIWATLRSASAATLNQSTQNAGNNFLEQGWFERAAMLAGIDDFGEQQEQLFDWQLLWDQHPASELPPQDTDSRIATDLGPIPLPGMTQRTALFLPLQGDLADISRIIIEGYITALQIDGGNQAEVVLLDSHDIRTPEQLFHAARIQGADFIVGPLDRQFVNQLAHLPEHPVTVLALNPAQEGNNPPLQLDLSSDQEATAMARRAIELGYRKAMLIRSNNRSGERFEQLLREAFEQQGGSISASLNFRPTESNSEQIRQLLIQDPEIARTMPNRSRSGMSVNVQHETDVIFMATEASDARLIRPMLLYHFAGSIPVMANSQLFEGNPSAARDTDLSGITFVDLPWRLAEPSPTRLALLEKRTDADSDIGKLYALGADAYLISQQLTQLLQHQEGITGETGTLKLGSNRRIIRELSWAQFINGVPQLITE